MSPPHVVTVTSSAPLARLNPTTKLLIAAILASALVVSADVVTAGIILTAEVLVLPWAGVAWRLLRIRLAALALLGLSVLILNTAVSDRGGDILISVGPVVVRDAALAAGLAAALRVMAIALPGAVLLATTDATDLADALAQRWRLPERFVVGALVAVRLVEVLGQEWQTLARARRARGLPGGTWRSFPSQVFGLLVSALRRAARLAQAVQARGLGVVAHRTWWRPSEIRWADRVALIVSLVIVLLAIGTSLALDTWRPLGS